MSNASIAVGGGPKDLSLTVCLVSGPRTPAAEQAAQDYGNLNQVSDRVKLRVEYISENLGKLFGPQRSSAQITGSIRDQWRWCALRVRNPPADAYFMAVAGFLPFFGGSLCSRSSLLLVALPCGW